MNTYNITFSSHKNRKCYVLLNINYKVIRIFSVFTVLLTSVKTLTFNTLVGSDAYRRRFESRPRVAPLSGQVTVKRVRLP